MKVAYLGPAGTYGEEAAALLAPGAEGLPSLTHAAAAQAAETVEADVAVLAIENSLNGSVAETLDILIHDSLRHGSPSLLNTGAVGPKANRRT